MGKDGVRKWLRSVLYVDILHTRKGMTGKNGKKDENSSLGAVRIVDSSMRKVWENPSKSR